MSEQDIEDARHELEQYYDDMLITPQEYYGQLALLEAEEIES